MCMIHSESAYLQGTLRLTGSFPGVQIPNGCRKNCSRLTYCRLKNKSGKRVYKENLYRILMPVVSAIIDFNLGELFFREVIFYSNIQSDMAKISLFIQICSNNIFQLRKLVYSVFFILQSFAFCEFVFRNCRSYFTENCKMLGQSVFCSKRELQSN